MATNPGDQQNAEGDAVSLPVVASDPDGDRLGYSASGLPRGVTIHPTTGLISGVLPFDSAQVYTTAVTASDGFLDVTVTFTWTVTNTNRPPVVLRPGDQSSAEGDEINLNLNATDADGQELTWSSTTLPAGLSLDAEAGVISGTIAFGASEDSPYDITLTVSDGEDTGTATFRWVVRSTNRRPTAVNPGDQTTAEAQAVNVAVTASDPDGDDLTWAATNLPPGLRIAPDTGVITGTVSYDGSDASPYGVVVIVSDGSLTHSVGFDWTVTNTNRAPTVTTGGPYDVAEGGSAALSASASDPDGSVLTYNWDLDDDGDFDDASGATAAFAGIDGPSTHTVRVRVSDGDLTATASATVTVRNVNPTITAMTANPPAPAESVEVAFDGAAFDPAGDADPLTFTWTFGDGSPAANGTAVTHTYADNGIYTVVLTVADDDDGVATRTLALTVGDAPPALSAVAGSPVVDEGAEGAWSATLTKAQGDTVAWTVQWGDGSADLTGSLPAGETQGTAGGTHTYADDGTYQITIRAVDDDVQTATTALEVTVRNVDPTITRFEPSTDGTEGETLPFSAAATDPGADDLTFTWNFGDGQETVGTDVTHAYASDGRYTATLTVTDGDGGTAVRTADVTIGDGPPSIVSLTGDTTGDEGATFRYMSIATDPGGDTLTYTWDFGDGSDPIVGEDQRSVSHVYVDDGVFIVRLGVSDGQAAVEETLTVTVSNVAPSFVDVTAPAGGQEGQLLSFAAIATDPGADELTYTWDFGDDTPVVTGATADHIFGDDGVYFAQLVVVDDDGGRAARALTIVIRNVAPSIVRLNGIFSGPEGTEFNFDAVVEDPGNDTPTFEWNFGDGSPIEEGENLSAVSHVYGRRGSFTLVLTVRDEDGGSAVARRTVNVGGQAPTVDAIDGDRLGDEGQLLSFTAEASEPGNDLITYAWDFGDGSPIQSGIDLQRVQHVYAEDGRYTLVLTATDADGEATATLDITVNNLPPTIVNVTAPPTGREGEVLSFEVDATDPGGVNDPLTYRWTWGDGTPAVSGRAATHAYARGGTYTVQVTVTDDEDASASDTRTVVIDNVAPTIARLFGPTSGDEGSTLQYSAAVTDPGAGELRYTWNFGDGTPEEAAVDLDEVAHAFADNGVYTVALTVEDEAGDTAEAQIEVTINNVAPIIISQPPQVARLGVQYLYDVRVQDPGADEISFELLEGPAGMAFAGSMLIWDLAIDQIEGGPYTVGIRVSDDDGASVDQEWEIRTDFDDIDMDGVPDDCELLYGLDPNNPDDGDLDLDMDGISNRDECLMGLDPSVFNGPSAPALVSPIDSARVTEFMPTLVVTNATDPDGDVLVYEFEIFTDEELTDQVAAVVEIAEGQGETSWQSEVELSDNSRYWWRARAADRLVSGPWSETGAFVVDMENEAPTVPNPVSPERGADSATPDLLVDPSSDPEGDAITYDFQVFSDETLETQVSGGSADDVTWTVADELAEGSWYWWRARATDALGASSDWSDTLSFKVNTANTLPDGPKIIAPRPNERVEVVPVVVIWEQAADAQSDPLLYELELATDEAFSDLVTAAMDIPMGDEPMVSYTLPPDLQEDATYWVRVRASDFEGAGPWASLPFVVNAQNTPAEAPTLISPIANETVVAGDVPLVVSGGADPDGQGITYTVKVFDDAATTITEFETEDVPPEGAQTTIIWEGATAGTYYWTAAAKDSGGLTGAYAEVEQFEVLDRPNTAPTAPVAVSPINDQDVDVAGFDLVIENATDPESDELSYSFAIYADEELTTMVWSTDGVVEGASGQTTVTVDDLTTTRSKLFWVAWASDALGAEGPRSEVATFTIVKTIATPTVDDCECSAPARAPVPHWILIAMVAVFLPLLRRRPSA